MQPEVQLLKTTDGDKLKELISVFEAVFEMERLDRPSATYLGHLLNKGSFFAVVALAGNKVIAGLTAYVLDQYYSEKPLMYLYDL
ncbi:MAG TPA: hypothetical protein VHK69_04780, partial [Chitinophagaceae bacterium]|nr:hypothetical protein [Chitinophagaceae bacterium]